MVSLPGPQKSQSPQASSCRKNPESHADEIRLGGSGGFVGENARVELFRQPAPVAVHAFDTIDKPESLALNFDA